MKVPSGRPLSEFLESFLGELQRRGIRSCVLRNHETLPHAMAAGDIDLLVSRDQLAAVLTILGGLEGSRVLRLLRRSYVVSTFIGLRGLRDFSEVIKLDLVTRLEWRGFEYLDPHGVLDRCAPRTGRPGWLNAPHPVDEAIISLMSPLLSSGNYRERYLEGIRQTFRHWPDEVAERLDPALGVLSSELVEQLSAEGGLPDSRPLRRRILARLALRSAARKPIATGWAFLHHVLSEIRIGLSKRQLFSICLLGPDGAGKTALATALAAEMRECASEVRSLHLKPFLLFKKRYAARGPVTRPHASQPRSAVTSTAKILLWLVEAWLDRAFSSCKNLTVAIYDRCFHDVLIDPRRYRYGAPARLASLIARLMPNVELLVILDAPPEIVHARKSEVSFEETARQREAYLRLASSFPNSHVVDASLPPEQVVEQVKQRIFQQMAIQMAPNMAQKKADDARESCG